MSENHNSKSYFTKFLATQKLRLTSQREVIFDIISESHDHINIDDILALSKSHDKNISLATVYRTVKLLTDAGIISEIKTSSSKPKFESIVGKEHHDHLFCISCGEKIEFVNDTIEKLQKKTAKKFGYKLLSHTQYLYGICKNCTDRN